MLNKKFNSSNKQLPLGDKGSDKYILL